MHALIREFRDIRSGPKELRGFAWVMAFVLTVIALYMLWRHGVTSLPLWVLIAAFALPALIDTLTGVGLCIVLLPLQKVWMALALVLGSIMSYVLLAVMFFGLLTPMGVIARALGRPQIDRSWEPGAVRSHWIRRDPADQDPKQCEKQH